jgi:hypothetical protein
MFIFNNICLCFRCVCGGKRVHTGGHFSGALLRHLSAAAVQKLADSVSFLQDNRRCVDSVYVHHDPHSGVSETPETDKWHSQVRRILGQSHVGKGLHDISGFVPVGRPHITHVVCLRDDRLHIMAGHAPRSQEHSR